MNRKGYTIIEVIVSLMVIGLTFSIILPGFYTINMLSEKALIDRSEASKERHLNLFLRKQVYQSDCIYLQDGDVYLRDLEPPSNPLIKKHYNRYEVRKGILIRYKFKEAYQNEEVYRLVSIGLGSTSQFEDGIMAFSIKLVDENNLLISYQIGDDKHELFIEHGKKILRL